MGYYTSCYGNVGDRALVFKAVLSAMLWKSRSDCTYPSLRDRTCVLLITDDIQHRYYLDKYRSRSLI